MISLPALLGFLVPLPARFKSDAQDQPLTARRRAIEAARLSPHLLRDVGVDGTDTLANDPRWSRRIDLER